MKLVITSIGFVALFLVWSGSSIAATYYVKKTGSDSYSCTQILSESTPASTINKALNCVGTGAGAGAGHIVQVHTGTYSEAINNNMPGGASWSAPFTLMAKPGETVLIRPGSGSFVIDLARSSTKYVVIKGLILDGTGITSQVIKWRFSSSTGIASFVRIEGNEIRNANPSSGLLLNEATTGNEIIGNWIHHNGGPTTSQSHGIYNTAPNTLVKGNIIEDNYCKNVTFQHASGTVTTSNGIIQDNIIRRAGKLVRNGESCGTKANINLGEGNDILVFNNVISDGSGAGIAVQSQTNRTKLFNNTIYDNAQEAISIIYPSSQNLEIKNNIFWGNGSNSVNNKAGISFSQSNNLTSDPKFANVTSGDFRLQSGSPAIDKGVAIGAVTTDFDGVKRPQGLGYDIGAFEFRGTTVETPATPSNLQVTAY
jgi:hypothetical protein